MIIKYKQITNKNLIVTIITIASLSLCASAFAHGDKMESSYNETLTLALQANEKVVALEHQWTTVPELLEKAKVAANKSDFASANKFATEALKQAELGIEQAQQQAKRWVNSVPR